jgi:hypothetical protein
VPLADAAERNVISGNKGNGVEITDAGTDGNVVAGNYIGISTDGTVAIGNTYQGVSVASGAKSNRIGSVKKLSFVGALAALLCLGSSLQAGTFEIRNNSKAPIVASICYYVPGSDGQLGDGTSFDAPEPAH